MSEVMRTQIEKLAPERKLSEMYMVDVQDAVFDVFSKIGYLPSKNITHAIDVVWANSNRNDSLSEFIFQVWRNDNG